MERILLSIRSNRLASVSNIMLLMTSGMAFVAKEHTRPFFLALTVLACLVAWRAKVITALGLIVLALMSFFSVLFTKARDNAALTLPSPDDFAYYNSHYALDGALAPLYAALLCGLASLAVLDNPFKKSLFPTVAVIPYAQTSPENEPFAMGIDTGSLAVASLLLWLNTAAHPHVSTAAELAEVAAISAVMAMGTLIIVFFAATAVLERLVLDLKYPYFFPFWMWWNTLYQILPQELIFRGVVQTQSELLFSHNYGVILSGVIFGLAQGASCYCRTGKIRTAISDFFFFSLLALFLGWCYHLTDRVEGPMFLRFTMDFIHFFLFSYPSALSFGAETTGLLYSKE